MPAQVGHVRVAVVTDDVTIAHRAEEAAEREEGIEPALLAQVAQDPFDGVQDVRGHRVVGAGEHPLQVSGLVDGDRVPVGVHDVDRVRAGAERDPLLEHGLAATVPDQAHLGHPVEVRLQDRGPADPSDAEPGALALRVEGPDPFAAEPDVDDVLEAGGDADAVAAHREAGAHGRSAQGRTSARSRAGKWATTRATCGSSVL